MAIAFDTAGSNLASNATTASCSLTVGSLTNGILLIGVHLYNSTISSHGTGTPTVDGSGTGIVSIGSKTDTSDGLARVEFFYKLNPGSGAHTVAVTRSITLSGVSISAWSYSGVHQTTPVGTAANGGTFGSAISAVPTTVAGDVVVDCVIWDAGNGARTLTFDGSQTSRINDAAGNAGIGASQETAAGTSTTMSGTLSGSTYWASVAVALKASGGATFSLPCDGTSYGTTGTDMTPVAQLVQTWLRVSR